MAKRNLNYYKDLAELMVSRDADRDRDFENYEDIYHCEWDLPGELSQHKWFYKDVSMDGHDAVETIIKIMTNKEPRIDILPMLPDAPNKRRANELEHILKYHLHCANRKRQGKVEADVVKCASLFDEVAVQVVDIDWQIKQVGGQGGDTKKWEAAKRNARFAINVYNSKNIHTRYSPYGPEVVLLRVKRYVSDVIDEWGEAARFMLEGDELDMNSTVTYNDMIDFENRVVWLDEFDEPILPVKPHELPFFPWVCAIGGSTIEDENKNKRHPLLYSMVRSGAWNTQNILNSLIVTRAITLAAQPVTKEEGSNPDSTEIDFTEPGGMAKVPPGNTLNVLPAIPLDPKTLEARENFSQRVEKTTVSRILQNGNINPGVAFASLNLATLTALGAIKPIKGLAEKAMAGVFELMLQWSKFTGKDLFGYGYDKESIGKQYLVPIDEISPDNLHISVELVEDLPIDQAQRAATAMTLVDKLGMSKEDALEMVGMESPERTTKIRFKEMLLENRIAAIMEKERAMAQLEIQAMQMQMQMQVQQVQMQMQGEQNQAVQWAQNQSRAQTGANGQAYNPAQGGIPPSTTNPSGMTREQASGQDRTGNPMSGGAM